MLRGARRRARLPEPRVQRDPARAAELPRLRAARSGRLTLDVERALDLWLAHRRPPSAGPGVARGTAAVVRAFQEEAGLDPDGVVGPQTRAALDAVVPAVSPRLGAGAPTAVSFPAHLDRRRAVWCG